MAYEVKSELASIRIYMRAHYKYFYLNEIRLLKETCAKFIASLALSVPTRA